MLAISSTHRATAVPNSIGPVPNNVRALFGNEFVGEATKVGNKGDRHRLSPSGNLKIQAVEQTGTPRIVTVSRRADNATGQFKEATSDRICRNNLHDWRDRYVRLR